MYQLLQFLHNGNNYKTLGGGTIYKCALPINRENRYIFVYKGA